MTTKEMLQNVLTTLYIGVHVAEKMKTTFPDSDFMNGYHHCMHDRMTLPYTGTTDEITSDYLYKDYILWRYNHDYWEKYSEVLNCEQED